MSKAPSTTTEMHDYLVEHGTATAEEIELVTSINSANTETYEDILYARTGYRSFDQLEEFSDDEECECSASYRREQGEPDAPHTPGCPADMGDDTEEDGGIIEHPTWADGCRMTIDELPHGSEYRGHINCQRTDTNAEDGE